MTLQGANVFNEGDNSTIYTMNSLQTGQYCVVIPKNLDNNINMIVDLNMKSSFDSLMNNTVDKDSLIKDVNDEYNGVLTKYPSGVLVFPMFDINDLTSTINSNDKQKMFDETKRIGGITSEIYQKLTAEGIDKSKIDQKIIILEKTDIDNKFVTWLKEQMPNFVDGVNYSELKGSTASQDVNPFTGEPAADVAPAADIFGAPVTSETSTEPVTTEPEVTPDVTEPEAAPAIPDSDSTNVESTNVEEQAIPEPKPVTDTKLETTQVIPEVKDSTEAVTPENQNVEPAPVANGEEVEVNEIDKKSGGFANLLILLVILVVVTIASIELGKFLYNTFGA
ncbi:MAG: hypothetical protein VZS44_00395 [Bacilli bacterium]|nr:hypothetical protein [Bacilli bacterium]